MWFIDTDNIVKIVGLRDAETETYINNATVTGMLYKLPTLNPDAANIVINIGSGLVGINVTSHGLHVGDTIRIENTINYDAEHILKTGTTINMLVFTAPYIVEIFSGEEFIYEAIVGTVTAPIPFHYVTASNG